jgi:pSer/pThr/pTyr-binding forkhead associated (FHA) protein
MADTVPVLIGSAGLVQGEIYVLAPGVAVIVGRSRSCDISLRRTPGYMKSPPDVRDTDHDFNTVSRRHARIEVSQASRVRVEDLSTNGSYVNGNHLSGSIEVDLTAGAMCNLRFGTRESFDLVLLPKDDPRLQGVQTVAPAPQSSTEGD